MPPTISLIDELALMGYEIIYVTIYPDTYYHHFDNSKVINKYLYGKKLSILDKVPNYRLLKSIAFRLDNLIKTIISRKLSAWLKDNYHEGDILWIVNEMTIFFAGANLFKKYNNSYIFSIYELHPNNYHCRNMKKVAQNAALVVVPEYNRAHMQKYFWNLKHLPFILPNKPLVHPRKNEIHVKDVSQRQRLFEIKQKGKKIILYMGIIGPERPLDRIIEAVAELSGYELVVLGRPSLYLKDLLQRYPGQFTYLGQATAPDHLSIASFADIGLLVYVTDISGLNALYCAPNKIFEYTGFSIPIIANNIPGLNYYVEKYGCGEIFDLDSLDSIKSAILSCSKNYENYSNGARLLYEDVDLRKLIEAILIKYSKNRN